MNTNPRSTRFRPLQRTMHGVTLIEMMISLTIGLMIIAGIGYAYLGSKQGFRSQDALSRMQEGARTAFEIMDRDIRMTGFLGCPPNPAAAPAGDNNTLTNGTTTWYKNLYGQPLAGYDAIIPTASPATASPAYPAGVALTGTGRVLRGDALTVLHADNSKEFIVDSHDNTATSQITLTANHDIKQGEILIAAKDDCSSTAIFQKTNACTLTSGSCGNKIVQLGRDSTTTQLPLGTIVSFNANTHPLTPPANSRIYRLSAATYYIGANPDGEPALYREVLGASGGNPATTAEELIEGVQDMQLLYGEDTDLAALDKVDVYRTANNVVDWSRVLGIRVRLLMVSRQDEQGITTQAQQYALDMNGDGDVSDTGETVTPTDRLLRKVFTTTIAVKNRL